MNERVHSQFLAIQIQRAGCLACVLRQKLVGVVDLDCGVLSCGCKLLNVLNHGNVVTGTFSNTSLLLQVIAVNTIHTFVGVGVLIQVVFGAVLDLTRNIKIENVGANESVRQVHWIRVLLAKIAYELVGRDFSIVVV